MTTLLSRPLTLADLKPVDDNDVPDVYPRGRRCTTSGCVTRLCIYNPGPACYCHTRDPNPEDAEPGEWEEP